MTLFMAKIYGPYRKMRMVIKQGGGALSEASPSPLIFGSFWIKVYFSQTENQG